MTLCTGYATSYVGGKATNIPFNGKICSARSLTLYSVSHANAGFPLCIRINQHLLFPLCAKPIFHLIGRMTSAATTASMITHLMV